MGTYIRCGRNSRFLQGGEPGVNMAHGWRPTPATHANIPRASTSLSPPACCWPRESFHMNVPAGRLRLGIYGISMGADAPGRRAHLRSNSIASASASSSLRSKSLCHFLKSRRYIYICIEIASFRPIPARNEISFYPSCTAVCNGLENAPTPLAPNMTPIVLKNIINERSAHGHHARSDSRPFLLHEK